tara:strand:+ start:13568 stop:15061 length:1494 start_codon:yes stop_codon:yes gene_type:complete
LAKVWKKLQRADSDFTGNVTGTFGSKQLSDFYRTDNKPTKADVGLGNIDNSKFDSSGKFKGELIKTDGTSVFNPSTGDFTGKIDGTDASTVKSKAEDAKDAIDGNKSITMVGGSLSIGTQSGGVYPFSVDTSGNLKIKNDEFQALADGTVNCKGNFTINQDSNGDSKIVLVGDSTGTAECEVQGANPTFDLGGSSPLGTSTLFLRRGTTGNQARILFQTGTTNKFGIGVSHTVDNDQFWIHNGNGYSGSSPHPERVLSFNPDGKTGFFANSKTVAGFTFGSDGTNKHVYIKDGGLGIGTTSIQDGSLNVNNNVDIGGDLQVATDCTFEGDVQIDGSTTGISYSDLSSKPTIPSANTLSYSTSTIDGNGYIWVMPTQFMANDDNSYFNAAIVDNGAQARVMSSSLELYANVPIPTGYKVTHFRLNGTSSVNVAIYYSDVTTSTATSAQVTSLYTNADNSVNPSSGIAATSSGRYIILKWQPTSTSHRLYGARLTITKV